MGYLGGLCEGTYPSLTTVQWERAAGLAAGVAQQSLRTSLMLGSVLLPTLTSREMGWRRCLSRHQVVPFCEGVQVELVWKRSSLSGPWCQAVRVERLLGSPGGGHWCWVEAHLGRPVAGRPAGPATPSPPQRVGSGHWCWSAKLPRGSDTSQSP